MVAAAAVVVLSMCIDEVRMRLLWLSIICFVLFMQLKCLSIRARNLCPIFVMVFLLKGGVGEPITPLEPQLRIKLMMHDRSQLVTLKGKFPGRPTP